MNFLLFKIFCLLQNLYNFQNLMEEKLKNPSPSLEERIESAKRRAHQVRVKIQQDLVSKWDCSKIFKNNLCGTRPIKAHIQPIPDPFGCCCNDEN